MYTVTNDRCNLDVSGDCLPYLGLRAAKAPTEWLSIILSATSGQQRHQVSLTGQFTAT